MAKKYPFKYQGAHHCEAAVICCIDFLFWRETADFVKSELGIKDFDFPKLPGSAKAINECAEGDTVNKCLSVPCDLHQVEKIVIVNHADCGAYGGSAKFNGDSEAEQKFHEGELRRAKDKSQTQFPDKEVILVYAKLVDEGTNIEFLTFD